MQPRPLSAVGRLQWPVVVNGEENKWHRLYESGHDWLQFDSKLIPIDFNIHRDAQHW